MWFLELLVMIDLWENVLIAVKPSRNKIRTANHLILRYNYSSVTTFQQPSRFETKIEKLRNSERFLNWWYLPNCSRKQTQIYCSRKLESCYPTAEQIKLYFWVQYWQTKSVAEKVKTETSGNLPIHNKKYIFVFWGSHIIKNLVNFGAAYDTKKYFFLRFFLFFQFNLSVNASGFQSRRILLLELCPTLQCYAQYPFTKHFLSLPRVINFNFLFESLAAEIYHTGACLKRETVKWQYISVFQKGKINVCLKCSKFAKAEFSKSHRSHRKLERRSFLYYLFAISLCRVVWLSARSAALR